MLSIPRSEVEQHFASWRQAIDGHSLELLAAMLTPNARGENAVFGIVTGRDAVMQFMARWPESVPNQSLWVAIDGLRVVNQWRETLPGEAPVGQDSPYDGISEFAYAGNGHWSCMYGLPDVARAAMRLRAPESRRPRLERRRHLPGPLEPRGTAIW
jgi:hypothetical protein